MPNRTPGNAQLSARVRISDVTPQLECGRYAVKRVVGDALEVHATVVADGHAQVRAELRYRLVGTRRWNHVPMIEASEEPDRFSAAFRVETAGRWEYTVAAWVDAAATWHDELRRKVEAGETELSAELAEGEHLLGVELPDVEVALDSSAESSLSPASTLRRSSSCHVAAASTHAPTVYSQRPVDSTRNAPENRSGSSPASTIGMRFHRRVPTRR